MNVSTLPGKVSWFRQHPDAFLTLLALFLLAPPLSTATSTPTSLPPTWVVGISPFLEPDAKQAAFQQVVRLLVTRLPLDTSLVILDAYHLRTVARMDIPHRQAFTSEKTRLNQFSEGIRLTQQFLATDHPKPEAPGLNFDAAVRTPQFLDFVSRHLRPSDRQVRVILLGSPLYADAREPGFSMVAGFFPSDGHLLASRDESVYGLADRETTLRQVQLDWGFFGDPWTTELHRERIQRFWELYLHRQAGHLGALSADLPTVFRSSLEPSDSPASAPSARTELDDTSGKVEMLRLTRGTASLDWIASPQVLNPAQGPPATVIGPLKIGIRWSGDWDLDLYARPAPGKERLYFEHPRTAEGYYHKDHRTSPEGEYEFIEFTSPVDVREVEASVNFYQGTSPVPPVGEVRLEFEGRVYQGPFTLQALRGNQGREDRQQDPWWSFIDVSRLLGLSRPPTPNP